MRPTPGRRRLWTSSTSALDECDGFIGQAGVGAGAAAARASEFMLTDQAIEIFVIEEARRYFNFLFLTRSFGKEKLKADSLLSQGLLEQMTRLGTGFQPVDARPPARHRHVVRWMLEHGDSRALERVKTTSTTSSRACSASRCLPVLEDMPREERLLCTLSRRVRVTSRKRSCS